MFKKVLMILMVCVLFIGITGCGKEEKSVNNGGEKEKSVTGKVVEHDYSDLETGKYRILKENGVVYVVFNSGSYVSEVKYIYKGSTLNKIMSSMIYKDAERAQGAYDSLMKLKSAKTLYSDVKVNDNVIDLTLNDDSAKAFSKIDIDTLYEKMKTTYKDNLE